MKKILIPLLFICSVCFGQEVFYHEQVPVGEKAAGLSFSVDEYEYLDSDRNRCEFVFTYLGQEHKVIQEEVPLLITYFRYLRDEAMPNNKRGYVTFHSSVEGNAISATPSGGKWIVRFSNIHSTPFFSTNISAKDADIVIKALEEAQTMMKSFTNSDM